MADDDLDDEPLWRTVLTHELLWVLIGSALILGLAFHLATK